MLRVLGKSLLAIPVAITFYDNVGYPAVVDGTSMQPTLNPDEKGRDVVFINRLVIRDYSVQRNDIVAVIYPKDPGQRIIKRVIGIEGDVIKTRRYKEPYVDIPQGHFWAEGDNTNYVSLDSNVFGPVSAGLVIGRATHIIWPPSRWRRLERKDPACRSPVIRRPMPDILLNE